MRNPDWIPEPNEFEVCGHCEDANCSGDDDIDEFTESDLVDTNYDYDTGW